MVRFPVWAGVAAVAWLAVACDSTVDNTGGTGAVTTTGASAGGGGAGGSTSSAGGSASGGSTPVPTATCFDAAPPGAAEPPAPIDPSQCPETIVDGWNTLQNGRKLMVVVPKDLAPEERPPVAFLWHWLGGSAKSFYEKGDVQTAVDHYRFIAVIPENKGDLQFKWPIEVTQSAARIDEEVAFFDEMLGCVARDLPVNRSCVSSAGVSAGALWTPILASKRGEYLSSMLSLSGGSGGIIKAWGGSKKKLPAMVLWGGPMDNCFGVMDFVKTSQNLEAGLSKDGHFILECIHNCGHAPPPFAVPGAPTAFVPMWEFIIDHPYWLAPGQSPYSGGLPPTMPEWCGVGPGSATPRTGECAEPSGC